MWCVSVWSMNVMNLDLQNAKCHATWCGPVGVDSTAPRCVSLSMQKLIENDSSDSSWGFLGQKLARRASSMSIIIMKKKEASIYLISTFFLTNLTSRPMAALANSDAVDYLHFVPPQLRSVCCSAWSSFGTVLHESSFICLPSFPKTELGTSGIFYFFNNKKWFFALFIKLITYFCTSPI